MAKTKNDIILAALRHLTVIAADEPAQAEDLAYAGDVYDGLYAQMFFTQELDVGEENDIPDEQFLPFRDLLASEIAPYYSMVGPRRSQAIMALRAAVAPVQVDTTVKADYF